MFATSVGTYLISKEIYVLEHEFYNAISFVIIWIFLVKKFGPPLSKFLEKEQNDEIDQWENNRKERIEAAEEDIKAINDAVWRAEGQTILAEAKRENIKMQLEAVYRERLAQVYKEVYHFYICHIL